MLSNAYFLVKFRFDTSENEPAKNLQNFANFPNSANPNPRKGGARGVGSGLHAPLRHGGLTAEHLLDRSPPLGAHLGPTRGTLPVG